MNEDSHAVGSEQGIAVVRAPVGADLNEVVASLEIRVPAPVLIVSGSLSASDGRCAPLTEDIQAAARVAARRTGAVVLDGTSWVGSGEPRWDGSPADSIVRVASQSSASPAPDPADTLPHPLGAAGLPPSPVSYPHVVLADTEPVHDDAHLLADLGQAVAHGLPIVLLLVGGDGTALAQAMVALERGFDVFVAAGSGGAADQIATAMQTRRAADPALAVIVDSRRAAGARHVHIVTAGVDSQEALSRKLVWAMHCDRVLKDAWHLFTTFDRAAIRLRAGFERFQATILLVGLLATLVALLAKQLGSGALRWAVVAASISLAGLTALSGRRAAGKRWIATRAAAESVKSEIFRYRTRTGRYADSRLPGRNPARRSRVLAVRLGEIEGRLMRTEVGNSALPDDDRFDPPAASHSRDDGLSPLTADDYVAARIEDQLRYYHARLRAYDRRRQFLLGVAVLASSAGALVAAVGGQMWVALTSALAAAPLAYLAHLQVEKTIVTYNQSVAQLDDVLRRWHGRSSDPPSRQAFARLVAATEAILTAEHGTWVEEMTQAMRDLDNDEGDVGPLATKQQ